MATCCWYKGRWHDIARLDRGGTDWVVLGRPLEEAAKVTLDYKAPVAAAIMVAMVVMMVFDFIPVAPVTAVIIAGILMVLTGCLRNVEAAYKTINWETIVLFAAMLPMSLALEKTGASEYLSNTLVSNLGTYGPIALMAGVYFTTSLMTMFISNTVTAVLMAPIALHSAIQIGASPVPFLFAVTVAASMCFASPVFHAAQCACDACRTIHFHGLCESGASATGSNGCGDGIRASTDFPILKEFLLGS